MAFIKYASVTALGNFSATSSGEMHRVAFSGALAPAQTPAAVEANGPASYFIDGARKLNFRDILEKSAEKYQISPDPSNYLFEAIRANSTNVPNENHDAFHRDELLRFDMRKAMPVFMTYVGKPHHMNHKCFRRDTEILMSDSRPKRIDQVQVGDKVLDKDGFIQTVEAAWNEGSPEELTRIETKGYGTFFATSNHDFPVWVWPRHCACGCGEEVKVGRAYKLDHYKGGRTASKLEVVSGTSKRNAGERRIPTGYNPIKRIPAGEIKKSDFLMVPRKFDLKESTVEPERARLLGYAIAEANKSKKWTIWNFGYHEEFTWVADVQQLCTKFNVKTCVQPNYDRGAMSVRSSNPEGARLQAWLKEHGGEYAKEKELSAEVMSWPHKLKKELVTGMIRGDGSQHYVNSVDTRGIGRTQFVVAYTTGSAVLASQVRTILTQLGFPSSIEHTKKDCYILRTYSYFARDLAKLVWQEKAMGQEIKDSAHFNRMRVDENYIYVPVKSVKTVKNKEAVYNLTVSGSHSYQLYGGVGTFNCDDASRARGVILDAHYNESALADPECGRCGHKTAEETGRDASGIHCAHCGNDVKDEYVEILVAVDRKKDPDLIRGIEAGILNAGSMGCSASSTDCFVCGHVAKTVQDFCSHIKGAAKGTLWQMDKRGEFKRTDAEAVKAALKHMGWKYTRATHAPISASLKIPEMDFQVRKAFEGCRGVEFDEYSRVHRPADPKARTTELLKAASVEENAQLSLREETEQLIRKAKLSATDPMSKKAKSAQKHFYAVRVNGNDSDLFLGKTLKEAAAQAELGKRDHAEYFTLTASSLTRATLAATELAKVASYRDVEADIDLSVPDGMRVQMAPKNPDGSDAAVDENGQPVDENGQPLDPSAQPPVDPSAVDPSTAADPAAPQHPGQTAKPMSIQDYSDKKSPEHDSAPEEFGMLPPGAEGDEDAASDFEQEAEGDPDESDDVGTSDDSGAVDSDYNDNADMSMNAQKYANAYSDLEVEVFADKAVIRSAGGDILTCRTAALKSAEAMQDFGQAVCDSLLGQGLVRTAKAFDGEFASRVAADAFSEVMTDHKEMPVLDSATDPSSAETDHKEKVPKSDVHLYAPLKDAEFDHDDDRKVTKTTLETQESDHAEKPSKDTDALKGHEEDFQEGRDESHQTALDAADSDFEGRIAAQIGEAVKTAEVRLRKLHASRLEKAAAEHAEEMLLKEAALQDRFKRAMKIVAKRFELNLENSPLKAKVYDSLTVTREIGKSAADGEPLEYEGMNESLAQHLVEAAWAESAAEEAEAIVSRAAEFMSCSDQYLLDAERDLSKQAAVIPPLVLNVAPEEDVFEQRAAALRVRASSGNFNLPSLKADHDVGEDKASVIRRALSSGRVS